ncbi:hypothetical protein JHN63_03995 [Streptomyces sp. MBT65]|uniref:hypothetical protein n=1 Tax=Streptomyces sp. MBT65 TaxID=1488395 RepID=UPI00190D3F24|nr:hypothetical protein [Streptomyces sp. MBT65]MBK3572998.1 hypothetical protein [Streptomyces sp. MBT65]
MANQYPGPPPEQPPGQNPYSGPSSGPYAEGGYGYPQAVPPQPQSYPQAQVPYSAPMLTLGDIAINGDTIVSPAGPMPLRGAVWTATDMSRTEERIPPHAIVLAVVFFLLCFVGLLFLLMKERVTTGFVQVSVNSGGRHHSTMIPVQSREQVVYVLNQVTYAQSISM